MKTEQAVHEFISTRIRLVRRALPSCFRWCWQPLNKSGENGTDIGLLKQIAETKLRMEGLLATNIKLKSIKGEEPTSP